uniref:aldehyde dehydrogenase (NAD(+)) n=1 Tax=Albugo laibachii Nc14 TaxID=890382 RepID=F0WIS1_9STRA|nr:unnamed protein product [Albugo laibachii Nc14]|eukprot:CCA21165.1 unnamed protein product [Albugo laibachii Nc14]
MLSISRRHAIQYVHRPATSFKRYSSQKFSFLRQLGIEEENCGVYDGGWFGNGPILKSVNPTDNTTIASVRGGNQNDYEKVIGAMDSAKSSWTQTPAPLRGEVVRQIGDELRQNKSLLGKLISLEMGKIHVEALGEVQEAIDICDFAVGLSRALNGSIIPSERPGHFMMERYNPLKGHVGIITAFNFPCAVLFWNAALSLVCGNTHIWKPSESLSLTSIACNKIITRALERNGFPGAISSLICGEGATIGEALVQDKRVELVSFTGSTKVGRHVNQVLASRFGKSILELGGNNAMIVHKDADLEMALRATLFSAVGTAGQRCTSLRRLYLHSDIYEQFLQRLVSAYKNVRVGSPLKDGVLCGPLHNKEAVKKYLEGVETIKKQGGKVLTGGKRVEGDGNFVEPTVVAISHDAPIVQQEIFAPILYVMSVNSLGEAIERNNDVPQGLSSSLFTAKQAAIFKWTGPDGSDCGIVNVNIGPSGAEIGGAFGGEKDTGGGRESGSDVWKQYMRRSTCTINHSDDLPLAQGIDFKSLKEKKRLEFDELLPSIKPPCYGPEYRNRVREKHDQTSIYVTGPPFIALPEIFGLESGRIRTDADRLGELGYAVVLVDLTDGDYVKEVDDTLPTWIRKHLWDSTIIRHLQDAIDYMKGEVHVERMMSYGYCWGAWVGSHLSAMENTPILGHVSFHPSWIVENILNGEGAVNELAKTIRAPQLLLSAGDDPDFIQRDGSVHKILIALGTIGQYCDVHDYPTMKHGWVTRGDLSDPDTHDAVFRAWHEDALPFIKELCPV